MSIFRWTALLAFCCICTACGGSDDTPAPVLSTEQVAGIWKLKSWTGEAQNPDGTSYTFSDVVYVYVELHEDNTYALYQNVSAVGAVKFTGSYSLEASGDVQQFVRVETVPQEVLDASAEVRSAAVPAAGGIW